MNDWLRLVLLLAANACMWVAGYRMGLHRGFNVSMGMLRDFARKRREICAMCRECDETWDEKHNRISV